MMYTNYATFLDPTYGDDTKERAPDPPPGFTEQEGRFLRDVAMSHLLLSILGVICLAMAVLAWSQMARKMSPKLRHHIILPGSVWYPDYPNNEFGLDQYGMNTGHVQSTPVKETTQPFYTDILDHNSDSQHEIFTESAFKQSSDGIVELQHATNNRIMYSEGR
mmetsp:Transcript_18543/g.45503  ORF Transcript_18543/g.45503 Transcript_18543/m.45503 type:complete len:163 (+) Transcript_18543:224-712(+)